jgi:hypothetical protein
LAVNSAGKGANLNADKLDGKDFSAFGAQEAMEIAGPLPRENDFTSEGGMLFITAPGSGFRGTGTALQEGNIGMDVLLEGRLVATAGVYANERNRHMAFVDDAVVVAGLPAGQHTIRLEESTHGGCNTASETQNHYCTDTDFNDHFMVTVVEIPN